MFNEYYNLKLIYLMNLQVKFKLTAVWMNSVNI